MSLVLTMLLWWFSDDDVDVPSWRRCCSAMPMVSSLALALLLDIIATPSCRCCAYNDDDDDDDVHFVRLPLLFETEGELLSAIALSLSVDLSRSRVVVITLSCVMSYAMHQSLSIDEGIIVLAVVAAII